MGGTTSAGNCTNGEYSVCAVSDDGKMHLARALPWVVAFMAMGALAMLCIVGVIINDSCEDESDSEEVRDMVTGASYGGMCCSAIFFGLPTVGIYSYLIDKCSDDPGVPGDWVFFLIFGVLDMLSPAIYALVQLCCKAICGDDYFGD